MKLWEWRKTSQGRRLLLGFQMLLGLSALLYAGWGIKWLTLFEEWKKWDLFFIIIVVFLMILDILFMGFRLFCLFNKNFSLYTSIKAVVLCSGYNNILPAKAGDIIKIFYLFNKKKIFILPEIAPIIVWERILDICVLFLLWVFFINYYMGGGLLWPSVIFVIAVLIFGVMRRYFWVFFRFYKCLRWKNIGEFLRLAHSHGIIEIRFSWFFLNFLLSVLTWTIYYTSFYVIINIVGRGSLSWIDILVIFSVTCTGIALPSSPGNIGLFEASMVLAMSWYGFTREESFPLALLLHAIYFLPTSIVALILTMKLHKKKIQMNDVEMFASK